MVDEEGSPPALPPEADPAAPVKATRVKKAAPSKRAAGGTKKAAPAKKASTAKKAAPTTKAAAARKSAGAKKAGSAKKAAPAKRASATKKVAPSPWAAADFVDEAEEIGSEAPPTESMEPPPPPPPPAPSPWGPPTTTAPPPPAAPPPPPAPGYGWQEGAFPSPPLQSPPPAAEKNNRWLLPLLLGLAALAIVGGIVALVLILKDDGDSSTRSTAPVTLPRNTQPSTSQPGTPEPDTEAPSNGSSHLDALFDPVAGFTFVPAPEIAAAFRNQLEQVPTLSNVFEDSEARRVEAGGADVAVVVAVEFNPKIASNPGLESGFNAGATVGSESTEKVTIDGQEATHFRRADGTTGYVFVNNGIGVVVAGDADASTMEALVKGLIANANGAD
jgi:hypothetical protein